jgi:hypothetical protein
MKLIKVHTGPTDGGSTQTPAEISRETREAKQKPLTLNKQLRKKIAPHRFAKPDSNHRLRYSTPTPDTCQDSFQNLSKKRKRENHIQTTVKVHVTCRFEAGTSQQPVTRMVISPQTDSVKGRM